MTVLWLAAQAAPAPAGGSHWCHGFCQRENKQNNIIILHRTTSAKTRATATLRQRHIPPNVSVHAKPITQMNYLQTLDSQKQIQLNKLIEKYEVCPTGSGYIDLIISREKFIEFIDELTQIGLMVEAVSWWCHVTDENRKRFGCPHGYGGPMTKFGWFSEMSHDFDDLGNEIFLDKTNSLEQNSVKMENDKAKRLIINKQTIKNANGNHLTFDKNTCLTPGIWVKVPNNWIREES